MIAFTVFAILITVVLVTKGLRAYLQSHPEYSDEGEE